jgi:hypothetical protein
VYLSLVTLIHLIPSITRSPLTASLVYLSKFHTHKKKLRRDQELPPRRVQLNPGAHPLRPHDRPQLTSSQPAVPHCAAQSPPKITPWRGDGKSPNPRTQNFPPRKPRFQPDGSPGKAKNLGIGIVGSYRCFLRFPWWPGWILRSPWDGRVEPAASRRRRGKWFVGDGGAGFGSACLPTKETNGKRLCLFFLAFSFSFFFPSRDGFVRLSLTRTVHW